MLLFNLCCALIGGRAAELLKCLRSKSAQDLMPVIIWPFKHDQENAALRVQRGTAYMRAAMAQAGVTVRMALPSLESLLFNQAYRLHCPTFNISTHRSAVVVQLPHQGEQLNLMPPLAPIMPWGTTIDGTQTALPDLPLNLLQKGQFNKVPVIFGTVLNEGSYFVPALPFLANGTHFPPKEGDLTIGAFR